MLYVTVIPIKVEDSLNDVLITTLLRSTLSNVKFTKVSPGFSVSWLPLNDHVPLSMMLLELSDSV